MKTAVTHLFFLFLCGFCFSQKDALNLGDKYADDQVYVSVAYSQFYDQPASVSRSNFSYSLSTGFTFNKENEEETKSYKKNWSQTMVCQIKDLDHN